MISAKAYPSFGKWVRNRRKQLDLTQAELGRRAYCSEAIIRKIEADERKPSRQLAEMLIQALQISIAEREAFLQSARGIFIEELHLATGESYSHNLPTLLTSTIDRARDLSAVTSLLKDKTVHLVTLIGPPGIGKTRLSIHCGSELLGDFPDGVWFVDLAEVFSADYFIPTIVRNVPILDLPGTPNLAQLIRTIREKSLLFILDNLEQIVEEASLDIARILQACARVKILATSRVPLHLYGEHEYPVPPLSIPPPTLSNNPEALMQFEAVQLLVARIRQHQPQFRITATNAASVNEICNILEGIPLAIELAAASLRQMTLDELTASFHTPDWVKQLTSPARDRPQRQRSLENVIEWSYNLLSLPQRQFFRQLGIFRGRFDAQFASAVGVANLSETKASLNELMEHSLLVQEIHADKPFWRMLVPIHEYAASKLEGEERCAAERNRAECCLNALRELNQGAPAGEPEAYFQLLVDNFHDSLQWAINERQTDLWFPMIEYLEGLWSSLGYFKEGLDFLSQILALPVEIEPHLLARLFKSASDFAWQQHDFDTALFYAQKAAEVGRRYRMHKEIPLFLNRLGRIFIEQGKLAEAKETLEKALQLAMQNPEYLNPGSPLAQLGETELFLGNLGAARGFLESSLKHLTSADGIFLAMAETDLAEVELAQGNYEQARRWLVDSLELASQHTRRLLVFLSAVAGLLVLSPKGSLANAAHLYGAIQSLSERSGIVLGSLYQKLNQGRMAKAAERLSPKEWRQAYETGYGWEKSVLIEQAHKFLEL